MPRPETLLGEQPAAEVPTVDAPYAGTAVIMDADSHVMEPPGWLESYAGPSVRERLVSMEALGSYFSDLMPAYEAAQVRLSGDAEANAAAERDILTAKTWRAMGAWDPGERSRALDILGFKSQLVFPTFARLQIPNEADMIVEGHKVLNVALSDFCASDERLRAVAIVPWLDPATTLELTLHALDAGASAVRFSSAPTELSPTHPDFEPLWASLEERGVPFLLHISGDKRPLDPVFVNNGRPTDDPFNNNLRGKEFAIEHFLPEQFLSAMVLDGVFEAHPQLMGGVMELTAAWVVSWLRRLDHTQQLWGRGDDSLPALPMKASDYVHRNLFFAVYVGEPVNWLIEQGGEDLFMFASDYPHWEGSQDPIGVFEATMEGVSDSAREAFYSGNYLRLMREVD